MTKRLVLVAGNIGAGKTLLTSLGLVEPWREAQDRVAQLRNRAL